MTEEEQRQYIRDNYLDLPMKYIAKHIGRSYTFVKGQLDREGLHIPPEIIKARRMKGCFKKGTPPKNKGRRMTEWMSPEGIERTKNTRFKNGHTPHNSKRDGDVSLRSDGYFYLRVARGKWKPLHRVIWEKIHGPIPRGYLVQFKDGDSQNVDPNNLYLISRSDQSLTNKMGGSALPFELREAIRLTNTLRKTINEKQTE